MSVNTIWTSLKEMYPQYVILVKLGKFYSVYNKDAYIISYILKYQLKRENGKYKDIKYSCGFPDIAINKVKSVLEDKKINYLIIDRRNNYEEDEKSNNKNLNKYDEVLEKARIYANNKIRLDNIYEYFMENIYENETRTFLIELENKINERRKI